MSNISKLGMGIIAFEGIEHIKNITYEIRDLVDTIVICLQQESYHGEPIQQEDVDAANQLLEFGYVDDIIWFEAKDHHIEEGNAGPRFIETDKRNFILDYLENTAGCSHSLIIDSDEFYDKEDFEYAKSIINKDSSIKITYCQYINYYRDYKHLLVWPFASYVPFITQSSYRFDFKKGNFKFPSDPTRRYVAEPGYEPTVFDYNVIKMHHLSWIRLDITKKLKNWSAKKYFNNDNLESAILDRYMNYTDGQNAIITFNVPNYHVCVNLLPKQYIHPHFAIDDTPTDLRK
jgi:hypothetical protein